MNFILDKITVSIQQKKICENFSAAFSAGDCCAILGKNGAGKTTLLHALSGNYLLDSGEILLDKVSLPGMSAKARARTIGLLQQEQPYLFPLTVQEWIAAGRYPHQTFFENISPRDDEIINSVLQQFDLSSLAARNILELSGGEKQRAALATLLIQDPKIFLLDEPCNHLDLHYQISVLNLLQTYAKQKNKIMLLSLHDLNLVQTYCNKVIMLFDQGRIETGSTETLLQPDILSQLYQHPIQKIQVENRHYFFPFF